MPLRNFRRPSRLQHFNYSQPGGYFITICAHNRRCLFGVVKEDRVVLNEAGRMIIEVWSNLPSKFPKIVLDRYLLMPNHFHAIILIQRHPYGLSEEMDIDPATSLPRVIQWFKTRTTNEYIDGVKHHAWKPYTGKLWQRSYYDRIIRNDNELRRIREYIELNPMKWSLDRYYVPT